MWRYGIVVYPGGGHRLLAMDVEGHEIADCMNERGIAAPVLKYRLAQTPGAHYTVEGTTFADAQPATRLVRSRAKERSVGDGRLGVMGFLAGGALAPMAETRFDNKLHQPFWPARDNDRSHVVTTAKSYLAYEAAEISSERHVY